MKIYTVIEQEVNDNGMDTTSAVKSFNKLDYANLFLENLYENLYGECKVIKLLNNQYLYCETKYHKTYYRIITTHMY